MNPALVRLLGLPVLAVLTLAGCGDSAPPNALRMAGELGCPAAHAQRHPSRFAKAEVYCGDLDITTFVSDHNRDRWLEVASSFGGSYVYGDRWAIYAENTKQARHVQSVVGGVVL